MKRAFFAALLSAAFAVQAAPRPIVALADAVGDDNGDGRLVYPQWSDYEAGDLDLGTLQISRDDEGFWFEAAFRNPIRNPANAVGSVGPESLADFARKGFYQFNLDIYIDTDRIKGSGNTFTLPGRQARIDPGYAWERALVLTPRPEATRTQLLDVLAKQYPNRPQRDVEASIDQTLFFPTQVRVRGRTVAFFVPARFFGGSDGSDWALTALVTAARKSNELKLSLFPTGKAPLEELDMGVMQPQMGRPRESIGYGTGPTPSPIVDLLTRSAEQQAALLSSGAPLTGVSWGPRAVDDIAASANASRLAGASAAAPVSAAAETRGSGRSFLSSPWESLRDMFRGGASVGSASSAPPAALPVQSLLDPARPASGAPVVAAVPTVQTMARRLEVLQQLLDQKMIDEAEYRQQKQRILNEL